MTALAAIGSDGPANIMAKHVGDVDGKVLRRSSSALQLRFNRALALLGSRPLHAGDPNVRAILLLAFRAGGARKVTDSRRIAGLLGPTVIALAVSEAMNLRVMAEHPAAVGLVYLNGTLLFVAGVAIVQVHNRWTRGWAVLVTVMGWFAILGGVMRMFAPQATTAGATWVYGLLVALLAVGVVLTFKGYSRRESEEEP